MAGGTWRSLRKTVLKRKSYDPEHVEDTNLRRCLSRWDLTAVGVGSTLGVGVYVLIGYVAMTFAGPSVVLSFLVAAVAALFAGLCFAEFSARVPRAGAAYSYTYVALGEIVAFLIGWCNILEFVFGSASVAKGLSIHMDDILNTSMTNWFTTVAPILVPFMSPYFDFFAFLIVLTMGALLSLGVREVSSVNKLFSAVNMALIVFIVAVGAFAADSSNWNIPVQDIPADHGKGGFFPFGVWGTLRGAAVCFYGYVGFDSMLAAGEEVKEPRRVIPTTIVLVILVTLLSYISVAIVITMMVPYYMQGPYVAVSDAFSYVGWEWARWIVSIGSLFGLYASLFGAMFPLPRLLYSMSSDGLLIKYFSKLTESQQSPMIATVVPTMIIATLAGFFELHMLLVTMCFGTLLSYTAVASSVIIIRYRCDYTPGKAKYVKQVFGIGRSPTLTSARIIYASLVIFICVGISAALVVTQAESPLIPSSVLHVVALILVLIMAVQPQTKEELLFKTPLVPLLPCLSIYFNIHLMVILTGDTWIRIGIWIAIGFVVYFMRFCFCKREESNLKDNMTIVHASENGKVPVQIIVESPTPPDTITRISSYGGDTIPEEDEIQEDIQESVIRNIAPIKTEEIVLQQAYAENNEEKEAKIIDLLDQVLQAEEDTYGEMISLKEVKEEEDVVSTSQETAVHRKSLSELSDAGSDASLGNPGLSKYDVIAQVHREDLPRVNEEEEKNEREDLIDIEDDDEDDDEQVTAFNDCDSRTDESGYSDTIDRNGLSESLEEIKDDLPNIPVPPPLPDLLVIKPNFKKSYTIASKHSKPQPPEDDDKKNKPRESINSNSTVGEDNIIFGSDRQVNFMSKLNNIFQTKITSDDDEPRKRSHSTGNVAENTDFSTSHQRPPMFMALQNEITSKETAQHLRPVNAEEKPETEPDEEEDLSLTRKDLKSKLEGIFAVGGPQLVKPRLIKSNPLTPEDSYQTNTSSSESISKLPKMEKNDTLKRQKDKFSAVLNSFRQSFKDDDIV